MNFTTPIAAGALLGGIAVILGALGAHWLENQLSASSLQSFETAVRYQAWHALALLFLSTCVDKVSGMSAVFWLWLAGTILFSGSIYLLSTKELHQLKVSWLGPITPLGGLLMIAGWFTLFIQILRRPF